MAYFTTDDVHHAIRIILSDTAKYNTSLNYAVGYCQAALDMTDDGLRMQCPYILGNIEKWRHPRAKFVRIVLKSFSKFG